MSFIHRFLLSGLFAIGCISVCAETSLTVLAQQQTSALPVWKGKDGKYTLCDKNGTRLSSKAYDKYGEWNGELAWVMKDEKYGYINRSGKEVIPAVYENIKTTYSPEGVYAKQDNKWGLVNWQGKVVIPFQYDIVKDPVYELVHVYYGGTFDEGNNVFRNGKWGLLKQNGQNALTSSYDFMGGEWEDGMLWVNKGGKISPEGNIVGGKFGLIDSTATEVVPPRYATSKYAREAFKKGMANQFNLRDTIPYYIWNY